MRAWDDPEKRIGKYRIQFATHWHFHPRDVDELTVDEFEHFGMQADAIAKDEEKQRRELQQQKARGPRR